MPGYTDSEKLRIAQKYLLPKQMGKNALQPSHLRISTPMLTYLISHYARESGVRALEKQIARICRKVAHKVALRKTQKVNVDSRILIEKYLGIPPFSVEQRFQNSVPGLATGLAWTQYGGDILFVESVAVRGKGGFMLTGSLGEVMQESANIAYTYVRKKGQQLGLPEDYFDKHVLHVHVPAGATPKDGPSAGVTMAVSLYSLVTNRAVDPKVAMTGEITLTGRVLPVGGIKEKLLAAKRAHLKQIILPSENARELKEVEPEIKNGLQFIKVSSIDDCVRLLFKEKK